MYTTVYVLFMCLYVAAALDKKQRQRPITPINVCDILLSIMVVFISCSLTLDVTNLYSNAGVGWPSNNYFI